MASSNADFHFLRSPAPTRKALGQPKSTKIKVHRKSPARSFLDPTFDGESEFQRADSSKCDPLYDMSVKRPKRAILGRLTYKFQYGFVNCWRIIVWVAFLAYIIEICRKKLQQLRHLELFQNRNERKSTKKHDFGPIEAHIDMKVCQLLADYCLGCLSDICTRDLPEKNTTIEKPCTISLLSVEV